LVLSDEAAVTLSDDPAALEFIRDAFRHLKAIGADAGGRELLASAGIPTDAGIEDVSNSREFLDLAKTRQWGRAKQ
jgi:catalase